MKEDRRHYAVLGMGVIILLLSVTYIYEQLFSIPKDFPSGRNFVINENESLRSVSERLKSGGYISSSLLFRAGISFLGKERSVQTGGYAFPSPLTLPQVISTFVKGRPDAPLLSVTIPEGSTSQEVAVIISKVLPSSSYDKIVQFIAKYNADGKLFPSTYFLLPSYTEEDIIKLMISTFSKKVGDLLLSTAISSPLSTTDDVLILASLLEGEAKTEEDMKLVSGILITRLKMGMPLQVDVAKETYKEKGLPKKPINNPGLVAILSALHPTFTNNLYYITGNDGHMYYAADFNTHKQNIRRYLK